MRSRHELLKLSSNEALLGLLLVLLLGLHVLAVCPSVCSCSQSHREVDCSWRGLRQLPDGLQHNLHSLNLSHNRFHNLDDQLSSQSHLRILDLSHNRLSHLPTSLPRSLWQLYAASNRIHLLDKNDTVYQWNLRTLDLSSNNLERAIFINNTLINLCTLNLSYNHFWTLPTNMPVHLEIIDLSHNLLVKVLPGSLDRLSRLTYFYLHANRFSTLPSGVLDKTTSLRLITLGDNPWDCHLYADISYLLSWSQRTPARVLGCPCHTQPVCGGLRPSRTGGWHFASYNLPPLAASAQEMSTMPHEARVTGWWYMSVSALLSTTKETLSTQHHTFTTTPISISSLPVRTTGTHLTINHLSATTSPAAADHMLHTDSNFISGTEKTSPSDSLHTTDTSAISDTSFIAKTPIRAYMTLPTDRFFTTESPSIRTKKTTTLRTRSVRRQNQSPPSGIGNSSPAHATCSSLTFLHNLGLLSLILQHVF
ncbi:oligodendrocyte-myelin glycoprotein-like [Scomber scombrus]|uniref:oligodendrocyte-myelin glycoprotein-like n=1 Tax=Scomber scombrus TaxID=13677 RepID=UPI002DDA88F9|nr:oligodendrocyte-myelin glycoprotein-like [Scomber scombrus]